MEQLTVGRIGPAQLAAVERMLRAEPVQNVYLLSELRLHGAAAPWWAVVDGQDVRAVVLAGALSVPAIPDPGDAPRLAAAIHSAPRPHLMVGPRAAVRALHESSRPVRTPVEIRDPQPVMVVDRARLALLPPAPLRRGTRADIDALARAAAMMHREEMSRDSLPPDATAWRARMAQLVERGWSWCWTERGEVIFKAELSAHTPEAVQVQGVFTHPAHRGRGIGTAGMIALCNALLESVPLVSLYVNGYNDLALRLYRRVGFQEHGAFATVMY